MLSVNNRPYQNYLQEHHHQSTETTFLRCVTQPQDRGAEYCDDRVCLSLGLSVCLSAVCISGTTYPSPILPVGNESVPKIIINDTVKFTFLNCNQHFGNFKP